MIFPIATIISAASAFSQTSSGASLADCLPQGIKLTDVAEASFATSDGKPPRHVTVAEKLDQLGATCDGKNQLIDRTGRTIAFYHLIGCWGHPPPNYEELIRKQRLELEELKQRNTVIEMTCNPSGARIS